MHEDTEPKQEGCYLPDTGFNRKKYVQRPYFVSERPLACFQNVDSRSSSLTVRNMNTLVIPASTWDFDTPENRANVPYRNEYENGICKIVETIEKTPCERFLEIRQTKNFGTSSRSVYKRVKISKEIDDSIKNDSYLTLGTIGDAGTPTGVTTLPLSARYIEGKISENLEMIGSNKIPKNPPKLPTYVAHLTDELREEVQAYYDKTFPHF